MPIGKKFGVMLAIEGEHHFEVATFRSDSGYSDGRRPDAVEFTDAKEDAVRRDFTINGLFYDPVEKKDLESTSDPNPDSSETSTRPARAGAVIRPRTNNAKKHFCFISITPMFFVPFFLEFQISTTE